MPSPQTPEPQITEKKLEFGLWFARHKLFLKTALIIALIVIIAITWLRFLLVYADFFILSNAREKALEKALAKPETPNAAYHEFYRPQDLLVGDLLTFPYQGNTDLLLQIQNPNPDWVATFDYTFEMGNKQVAGERSVVIPGDTTYLISTIRGQTGNASFNISNTRWKRISKQNIPDFASYRASHLNFVFKNVQFTPELIKDQAAVSRVNFTLLNQSAWSYWQVNFIVLLYRGEKIAAVGQVTLDELRAGESRPVELSFIDRIGAVSKIDIIPQVNILDPSVYMTPLKAVPTE